MSSALITQRGGGIKINGLIESYKIKNGETINAGDFVDYINSENTTLGENNTFPNPGVFSTVLPVYAKILSNNKILFVYRSAGDLVYSIGTVNGSSINLDLEIQIDSSESIVFPIAALELNNEKIVILYRTSGTSDIVKTVIGLINGSSIT
jgi:hypothetical protein